VVEDQVEVVIQVSGKTRGRVSVPRDAEQGAVVAAAQEDAAGAAVYRGEESSEGGVCAESVTESGGGLAFMIRGANRPQPLLMPRSEATKGPCRMMALANPAQGPSFSWLQAGRRALRLSR
jgi:hypothetical protein